MNVTRLKLLQRCLAETPDDAWATYKQVVLSYRLAPCPALCAYAARIDLQQDYRLIHNGNRGSIWRDDGSTKWKLGAYFGISDEVENRIFGTGGTVPMSETGPLASHFIAGLVKAHESNLAAALERVEKTSFDLLPLEYSDDFTDSLPHVVTSEPTPKPTVRAKVTEFLKPKRGNTKK